LQEIIDQCSQLQTLQIGKHIYPTFTELNEINWSNLKHQLKELSITTKFQASSLLSGNNSCGASSSSSSSSSSSTSSTSSIDLYSSTIFNYLNDSNQLEYLALADFTLKFPVESNHIEFVKGLLDLNQATMRNLTTTTDRNSNRFNSKKLKVSDAVEINTDNSNNNNNDLLFLKSQTSSNLKYLFLRNIRNIKTLTRYQTNNLRSFLYTQFNLHTLDLIGLYLDSNFICSILPNLNNLK
jgi:hypothetical protein